MRLLLTCEFLRRICEPCPNKEKPMQSLRAACVLGGLSRWWLRPEVLRLAAQDAHIGPERRKSWLEIPDLPSSSGSCWIILVQKDRGRLSLLREAFLLPVRWVRGASHSPALPQGLPKLADHVAGAVADAFSGQGYKPFTEQWGLVLSEVDDINRMDLRKIAFDPASGFVSLAAGLILANNDGTPNDQIWATGASDGQIIRPVDDVQAKVALAAEWRASAIYMPSEMTKGVKAPTGVTIKPLHSGVANLRQAMKDYLQDLRVPPSAAEPRDIRKAYYLGMQDVQRREHWFRAACLNDIAEDCREDIRSQGWADESRHLVTIASGNLSITLLSIASVRPERCLVLHTNMPKESKKEIERLWTDLDLPRRPEFRPFDEKALPESMGPPIQKFRSSAPRGLFVFDTTPGNKLMSLALADHARPKDRFMYIAHKMAGQNLVEPFTQHIISWSIGKAPDSARRVRTVRRTQPPRNARP